MILRLALSLTLAGFLPGCTSLDLAAPRTFNERTAYALATITALRVTATDALTAKAISTDDAENVQALANRARATVDAARAAQALGNAPDAAARLELAEGILADLRAYLTTQGVKTRF